MLTPISSTLDISMNKEYIKVYSSIERYIELISLHTRGALNPRTSKYIPGALPLPPLGGSCASRPAHFGGGAPQTHCILGSCRPPDFPLWRTGQAGGRTSITKRIHVLFVDSLLGPWEVAYRLFSHEFSYWMHWKSIMSGDLAGGELWPHLYFTKLYCTILYATILYYTILYDTILYYIILYYTVLYCIVLYYTVLYYTILYYTTKLYYTIL